MKQAVVPLPDMILIAGTRVALGIGVGLLMSTKLREGVRRGAGWALLAIGGLTTIPLVMKLRSRSGDTEGKAVGRTWAERQATSPAGIHSPS